MRVPKFCSRTGMTLVEVAIASSLFAFIGYILTTSVEIGVRTQTTVSSSAQSMRNLREGAGSLRQSLRFAQASSISLSSLPSGDSELTLKQPLTIGGALVWGVHDRHLGATSADQSRQGWSLRYSVASLPDPSNTDTGLRHDLVYRLLDDLGNPRYEETLITDLFQGGAADPGFRVQQVGALYEVTIQSASLFKNTKGPSTTIQVRVRN